MSTRTVLVLGGTGYTGTVLVPLLAARGFVVDAPRRADLDLHDATALREHVLGTAPDAVIDVAAAQPSASDEALRAVNVLAAECVARAAAELGARLVHVASDAGLGGRNAPYGDAAEMRPLNAYGRSKAEGEAAVLAACPTAVSVRTSLLWDPARIDRGTASFAARLAAGEPCRAFTDEIRCPLSRHALAACLVDLIDAAHSGPLNVAGREPLSRYEFAMLLLRHFGVPGVERLEAICQADLEAAGAPARPRDLRLRVDLVEALLGRRMPGVRELLLSAPRG